MKTYGTAMVCALFFLMGCKEASLLDTHYRLKLPNIPQSWESMLGNPHWRIEWVDDQGRKQAKMVREHGDLTISLPQTWITAVIARPFWPEKGIDYGVFMPSGAIFPFDVSGKNLVLSWQGGVDAIFYWELASHSSEAEKGGRLPYQFNWPRFRQILSDESVHEAIRTDPWLANWSEIAAKTVKSGFDKRRLVPETRNTLPVPVNQGPWIGTSPFADPLLFETVPVFPVRTTVDTWVSASGIVRCNKTSWIFLETAD